MCWIGHHHQGYVVLGMPRRPLLSFLCTCHFRAIVHEHVVVFLASLSTWLVGLVPWVCSLSHHTSGPVVRRNDVSFAHVGCRKPTKQRVPSSASAAADAPGDRRKWNGCKRAHAVLGDGRMRAWDAMEVEEAHVDVQGQSNACPGPSNCAHPPSDKRWTIPPLDCPSPRQM